MNLAALIAHETGLDAQQIMFVRHGKNVVRDLGDYGAIEELTRTVQVNKTYDPAKDAPVPATVVVVVVAGEVVDSVDKVYRIGASIYGKFSELASEELQEHDRDNDRENELWKQYAVTPLKSICIGKPVRGWRLAARGNRTLRYGTGEGLFHKIEVDISDSHDFNERVEASRRDSSEARALRLAQADPVPKRREITSFVFDRNPDVVAQVLEDARGMCQGCGKPAPFKRRSNNKPYLEVHHKVWLSAGGEDTVGNAIALCPNCHREKHSG